MKLKKKILSLLLCAAMLFGLVQTAALAADTANITAETTNLTVASSASGENTSVVAFGGYEWYVIGYNGTGVQSTGNSVTLLSKNNDFGTSAFRTGSSSSFTDSTQYSGDKYYYANNPDGMAAWATPNEYAGSTLQQKMESIASGFSSAEQSLIIAKDLSDVNVTGQKVWPLSIDEWNTIGNANVLDYNTYYWLRSNTYWGYSVGNQAIYGGNDLTFSFAQVFDSNDAILRPALSLNLSNVLFASAADSTGKSSVSVGSVVSAAAPTGTIKYTFYSDELTLGTASVKETDNGLVLNYSGATTGTGQYISFVLKDANGNAKYYGKIADCSAGGSGEGVSIPLSNVADGSYTLSIFSEQANGDLCSDFAGDSYEIAIEVKDGNPTVKRYTVEIPVTVEVVQGGSVAAPAESFDIEAVFGGNIPDGDDGAELRELLAKEVKIETSGEPVATNGAAEYTGAKVTVSFTETAWHALIADGGIHITQKSGNTEGWDYAGLGYRVLIGKTDTNGYKVDSYEYFNEPDPVPITSPEKVVFTNTYTKNIYTIKATARDGGTITPSGSTEVTKGSSKTFTITANSGYKISDVKVDGVSQGAVASYTFTDVQAAHTIEATFEKTEATTNTSTNGTTDVNVPQTGDSSNLALWIGLMALAAAGLIGIVIYGKRRKYSR